VVELRCAHPDLLVRELRGRGVVVTADRDRLLIEGISARAVGDATAAAGAGPVYWLTERAGSFEDVYFALAGSMSQPPTSGETQARDPLSNQSLSRQSSSRQSSSRQSHPRQSSYGAEPEVKS
jgi:hypothetical protein